MNSRGSLMVNMIINKTNDEIHNNNVDNQHIVKMLKLNENPDPNFVPMDSSSEDIMLSENYREYDNHNNGRIGTEIQLHDDSADIYGNKDFRKSSPANIDSFQSSEQNNNNSGLKMINNAYESASSSRRGSFRSPDPELITLKDLGILSPMVTSNFFENIPEIEARNTALRENQNVPHSNKYYIFNNSSITSSDDDDDFSPTDGSEFIPSDKDSDSTLSVDELNDEEYLYSNVPIISEHQQNVNLDLSIDRQNESRVSPSILDEITNDLEASMADNEEEEPSFSGRPSRGRKRKCPQNRLERKIARNSNKNYFDHKFRSKESKDFIDYNCQCRKKCKFVVPVQLRRTFFNKFWSLGSYDSQTNFIGVFVKEEKNEKATKKKKFVRQYRIETFDVCRDMFCKTLNVCSTRIATAMDKLNSRRPLLDQRGKLRSGENRMPEERKKEIKDFINSIPLYTSHYSRANTGAKFFKPGVTLISVYNEYKRKYNLNAVSYSFFKKYFYDNFNIKVKILSKDTCNVCDKSRIEIKNAELRQEDMSVLKESHINHLKQAERARSQMKTDMNLAKNQEDLECITFDMQKTLPLPRLQTNIIFYKRQIWLYNLGVHSAKENQSYCYTWVEGQAGRGAQEVGSCLIKHIDENVSDDIKHLILWSDSCGGQNRNIKIILLMKVALQKKPNLKSITFKYLIPGHSYLPNDKDFGDIERTLKYNQRLYTPDDYLNLMKVCKKKNPLKTYQMGPEVFYSTELLEKYIVNRKKTIKNNKVNWLNTREIKITKDEQFHIYMKSDFDQEDYECLDITRKISNRRQQSDDFCTIDIFRRLQPKLWPNGKPIAEPKLRDIISIKHLIPEDARMFYDNLTSSVDIVDDVDGLNTEIDFDLDDD